MASVSALLPREGSGARVDKILFTINDVAEVFLAIRIHADGRVNE